MSSQLSSSSSTSTAPSNSRPPSPSSEHEPPSPLDHLEDEFPDPSPPSSPKHSVIASPPLDTRPYSPHGLGIGILSPQPVLGPFAPITRANLSPLQVRSSPVEQRSNPLESLAPPRRPTSPFEPYAPRPTGSRSPEIPKPPPQTPPALRYLEVASTQDGNAGEHLPLNTFSSAGIGQAGLRISIPPPNPTASTSTPSPPLLLQPTQDPVANSVSPPFDPGPSGPVLQSVDHAELASSDAVNVDFSEFDTEGCNALEKIYLFSRSQASFHRVFIAHALPRYLLGADIPAAEVSNEVIEQITPSEAVEYVLPLLNGLAMDEDEAVKEALAAELVPIIWWFITHCRLVEDDVPLPPSPPAPTPLSPITSPTTERQHPFSCPPTPSYEGSSEDQNDFGFLRHSSSTGEEGAPAQVSVQAFTPILGTLLLSPNGIKEDSASDTVEEPSTPDQPRTSSPTPSQASQVEYQELEDGLDMGFLQRDERRLFERELIYQVVIGMCRLDMDDGRADQTGEGVDEIEDDSGPSTAVPTPLANAFNQEADSYFPPATTLGLAADPTSIMPVLPAPGLTAESLTSDSSTVSPIPSPSPSISSASSLSGSPDVSTPSLTSSTSSSSGEYTDGIDSDGSDRLGLTLTNNLSRLRDAQVSTDVDEARFEVKLPPSQTWTSAGAFPRQAPLPTTPPFEVPPPPIAQPVPPPVEATSPITGLPILQVQAASPAHETPPGQTAGWLSPGSAQRELQALTDQQDEVSDVSEEAAVGRLSRNIGDDTKRAFVTELERVGRDPVYWVRREASFAVGALAKVVPEEVVTSSLLPLFESLCQDSTWHVRHSVLFALPAILARLAPEHRRQLALDVILPLSQDEESAVRSAVLEALGEVMYTFKDDEEGPPEQLLKLFLGIRETEDPGGGMHRERSPSPPAARPQPPHPAPSVAPTSSAFSDYGTDAGGGPDIYEDPQRPLVCAFNYPAVALTLGRQRWPELRSLYLTLAQDPSFKVRRTLAASLGEMAKIIGEEHARADLMGVFWSSLHAEESEVRMKILDAVQLFVRGISPPERVEVVKGLDEAFSSGKLTSWREREAAVKALGGLVEVDGIDGEVLKGMLTRALDDRVAAVREAAVAALPTFVKAWKASPSLLEALRADIRAFAASPAFRRRTTYVMCIQEMLVSDQGDVAVGNGTFWDALAGLVRDPIVDVRIRMARLLGLISDKFGRIDGDIAAKTVSLARDLAQDPSHEVQAFAAAVVSGASATGSVPIRSQSSTAVPPRVSKSAATFSRPPPPSPS
ncbi:ARM repeat-containing protein [Polyporus arcularius HHB13444]|uniref:ARM repeat-containing protein n=1 Tax=Polyporus arcularius HHB13444 TaxID=1314778 RepID=A0A5C3PPF7_9APHY|nr:ARM repeat-containing protein [Polyporus arcularius HHB13444]